MTADSGLKFFNFDHDLGTVSSLEEDQPQLLFPKQNLTCCEEYFDDFFVIGLQDVATLLVIDRETGVISAQISSLYDNSHFLYLKKMPDYDLENFPYLLAL